MYVQPEPLNTRRLPPAPKGRPRLTDRLEIRVEPEQLATWNHEATLNNLELSAWIRNTLDIAAGQAAYHRLTLGDY